MDQRYRFLYVLVSKNSWNFVWEFLASTSLCEYLVLGGRERRGPVLSMLKHYLKQDSYCIPAKSGRKCRNYNLMRTLRSYECYTILFCFFGCIFLAFPIILFLFFFQLSCQVSGHPEMLPGVLRLLSHFSESFKECA